MSKKVSKRILALFTCVMTIMQSVVPTYALEQSDTPEPISEATNQVIIETIGNGKVTVQENGNVHEVQSTPLTLEVPNGTTMNFTVIADEGNEITDITNYDVRIPQFIEPIKQVQLDYVITEDSHIKAIFKGIQVNEMTEESATDEAPSTFKDDQNEANQEAQPTEEKEPIEKEEQVDRNSKLLINEGTFTSNRTLSAEEQQILNDYQNGMTMKEEYVQKRKEIVDKIHAWKYVDDNYFITNKFYEDYDTTNLLVGLGGSILIAPSFRYSESASNTYSLDRSLSSPVVTYFEEGGHTSISNGIGTVWGTGGFWKVDGHVAFCGEAMFAPPRAGSALNSAVEVHDDRVRKVIYYAYGYPNNQVSNYFQNRDQALLATNEFLSAVASGTSLGGSSNGQRYHVAYEMLKGILNLPSPPSDFKVYKAKCPGTGTNFQGIVTENQTLYWGQNEPKGNLTIEKSSANPSITDNNDCYSLEGAEYGLYNSEVDANKDVNRVGTFTIKGDGKANTIKDLKVKTYYLKESKAPKGYALDPTIYAVNIKSGKLTTKAFVDLPQSDPISILLGKVDKETNANKPQGSASLENAEFTVKFYGGLYDTDPAKDGKKAIRTWVLKTDEQGRCRLDKNYKISGDEFWTNSFGVATLPIGTLTIQETKVPKGYKLNDEVFVRKITADGNSESVQTYNQPTIPEPVMLGDFSIRKVITSGNASEIVRPEVGAEFTAIYKGYIDQYGSFEEALKHIDEFQTNEHSKLVTNEQGIGTSGKLAYGTYVVKQTKATEETDILKESFEVTISKDGQHFEYTINNRPSTYYVKIVKKDADTGKIVTLNNASFQIVKHRKDGSIDANYSDKGQIKTDANGIVSVKNGLLWYNSFVTNADNRLSFVDQLGNYEGTPQEDKGSVTVPLQLPAGDYELKEINAPDGFLKGQSVKFSLKKDLVTETDPDGDAVLTVEYKDPKPKGRIELTKQFEDPDYIMHGKVTFDLIVVKDIVDPADGKVLYKANDVYGTYELNKDNNKIVIENLPMGVGESHFKLVEKTTYENYVLNTQEYPVDFVQTDMGIPTYTHEVTVENKLIKIRTQALNADTKNNQFNSAKQITVTDVVSYEGLLAGQEYTMHGVLMDKETGEPVKNADGTIVEGYKKFTPEAVNGTVDVKMTLDASQLGGKDFVVFESVLNTGVEGHETCEIARHHDLTDKNQTITILDSKIGTTAKSENGSHEQQVKDGKVTFIDTVAYENLVAGMSYKVSGVLMDKTTGKALLVDGKEVTSETTFTPEEANGTVDVTFEFDASAITSDTALVVFERLVEVHTDKEGVVEEIDVAQHEDIDDEGQTIHFIDIKTTAQSDNGTNEQQPVDKEITFTDTVHYEGLQVGKEYTVTGKLMNKETNLPLIIDGKEVTSETTFTPEEANGTVDVVFTLNAKDLVVGQDIVVFEDLIRDEIKIASHADINDKDQTIHIIDVKTKASSEKDNNVGLAGKKVTITDTVSYTNLEVGKEYTVKGVLMNKETNEPLLDADGNQITGETTFTPEEANGTVDVIFTLDSSLLAGKEVVVFEDLYKEDIKVGSHADINDKDQTIKFKNYEIKVNKVDSLTKKNIISNKFEFTMFSDKECEEEVLTVAGNTEDGTAVFEVKEGTWYIKETKAPQGYKLSKEVVKVEVKDDKLYVNDKEVETDENYLYSIVYQNALLPSLQTGSQNHGGMYFMMMCFSALAFSVFFMIRKSYLQ